MNYNDKMEVILIGATWTLCIILLSKILFRLRSTLPWRVNCWFCNSNSWVKYPDHNSWTCPHCEQYNGFTKDGDYNKILTTANEQTTPMAPKVFQKSPPKNGLCKMCNINQQLKVAQLANFVPMNEKKFNDEIEVYRAQLEKAYKLCSPCKRTLQMKLHKEKAILLGNKLIESRTPEKKTTQLNTQSTVLKHLINNTSMFINITLLLLISYEFYTDLMKNKNLTKTMTNFIEIITSLLDRVYTITKMYMLWTFPSMKSYVSDIHIYTIDMLPKTVNYIHEFKRLDDVNLMIQKALGGIVCLIQIVANIWNINSLKNTIILDILWSIFIISIGEYIIVLNPVITSFIKITCALALLLVYRKMKKTIGKSFSKCIQPVRKIKNCTNASTNGFFDNNDTSDTDDDVSLCKFGVHNLSESSNETINPLNASLLNGRCFLPKNNSSWTQPSLNSTFCVGSVHSQSPSTVPDTVFAKPSFDMYQKLAKDDSDSDLDQSISCLSIGPTKAKKKVNPVFLLRKFTATPSFRPPMPTSRPLLSPSKLGHTASWVAGGYWGSDGETMAKQQNIVTTADASRSSSQSSGFESQASSLNQRNAYSQALSREPSVVGVEPMSLDRFPNMSSLSSYITHNNYSRISSPVFPQMQFNSHVHLPQSQFAQQPVPPSLYSQQTQTLYNQGGMFRPPGGTGLMKLPQVNAPSLGR